MGGGTMVAPQMGEGKGPPAGYAAWEERRPVPRIEEGDQRALAAVHQLTNWENAFRYWHTQRMAYNLRFYRGDQWIRHFQGVVRPGSGIHRYSFERIRNRSLSTHPTPVDNMIATAVDNEVARLVKRQYVPSVKPQRHLPNYQRAAQLSRDILQHDLENMQGMELREQWAFDLTLYGTAIGRSLWDTNVHDLVPVGAPRAAICKSCDARFADTRVPAMMAETGLEVMGPEGPQYAPMLHADLASPVEQEDPGRPAEIEMKVCPLCDTAQELKEYDVEPQEVEDQDILGRPMGDYLPRGEPALEVVSPFDFYPENGGLTEPNKCRIHAQATVRDLDWILSRMPDLEGKIGPEDPQELRRYHPTLGDRFFSGGNYYSSTADADQYGFHALVREVHMDPTEYPGFEEGRSIIVVGDQVFNSVLTVDVKTPKGEVRRIPRVKYAAARCKRIPGEFWGRTWVDDAISPQRRLNEIDAQEDDHRRRGFTRIALYNGEEIVDHPAPGALHTLRLQTENAHSLDIRQRMVNGIQSSVTSQYHQQRDIIVQTLVRAGAPTEIESGINPPGVSTATEMLHLADESQVKREPRARQLSNLMEGLFSHVLAIRWGFQAGREEYERKLGTRSERLSYRGTDLIDQHHVKIEHTSNVRSTAYEVAAVKEANQMGLVDVTSPIARDKLLEILHIRKDLNEDITAQIERAEGCWIEFVHALKHPESDLVGDHALVPPIDQKLDAHGLWYALLGQRWQEEDGLDLQRRMGWDQLLVVVNGTWEEELLEAEMLDPIQRKLYSAAPPQAWRGIHQQASILRKQAEADEAGAVARGALPSVNPLPPIAPPPDPRFGFLPGPKDQRVLWAWTKSATQMQMRFPLEHPLVLMRARIEAHRLLSEETKRELLAGSPQAPAPGAGASSGPPPAPTPPGIDPATGGEAGPKRSLKPQPPAL